MEISNKTVKNHHQNNMNIVTQKLNHLHISSTALIFT